MKQHSRSVQLSNLVTECIRRMGEVMFHRCVPVHTGDGRYPRIWSFLGGTPVSSPRSLPRGYPSLWSHVLSEGTPVIGQGSLWESPPPLAGTGVPNTQLGLWYLLAGTGVPAWDWGTFPSDRRSHGQGTLRSVHLLRFHAGGFSCLFTF